MDTDALHVELADARRKNELLEAQLRKSHVAVAELKRRLDVNSEKRASMSRECSELRLQMLPQNLEVAKAAARSEAMVRAVDMVKKHDAAIEAQAEHLKRMHSDLVRMRKASFEFLEKHKQQLTGATNSKLHK